MTPTQSKAAIAATKVLAFLRAKQVLSEDASRDCLGNVSAIIELVMASKPKTNESEHKQLIRLWCAAYEEFFGGKYAFSAKDGKAVKTLLALAMKPTEIMALAERAWRMRESRRHFNCKFSVTLSGMASRVNEIRSELSAGGMGSAQVPRVISEERF